MGIDSADHKNIRSERVHDRQGIARRDVLLSGGFVLAASALVGETLVTATNTPVNAQARPGVPTPLPADEIGDVAIRAYMYAYPLILMEITRRVTVNVADASHFGKVPMNQFGNLPAFPDATFTDVVRPNADTLYSFMWFDVSKEPLLISVPDSEGRYYLLPMLDMWTDVFEVHGQAHDRAKRAAARDRRTRLAGQPACGSQAHS